MDAPQTSPGAAQREQRQEKKLNQSPGSFFKAQARDLVLAAQYFEQRLQEGTYTATAARHHHTLSGATFAMLLSSFELVWKSLYARIIDATTLYDENILKDKDFALDTEIVLAHRETVGAGAMIASATSVWQRPELINKRFSVAFEIEPIDPERHAELSDLWQIRHIIAHSSGVTSDLDSYRLKVDLEAHRALQITDSYLEATEGLLMGVTREGVTRVGDRVLTDFFSKTPAPEWQSDRQEFEKLYLIGHIVSQTSDLPEVTAETFQEERNRLQP